MREILPSMKLGKKITDWMKISQKIFSTHSHRWKTYFHQKTAPSIKYTFKVIALSRLLVTRPMWRKTLEVLHFFFQGNKTYFLVCHKPDGRLENSPIQNTGLNSLNTWTIRKANYFAHTILNFNLFSTSVIENSFPTFAQISV